MMMTTTMMVVVMIMKNDDDDYDDGYYLYSDQYSQCLFCRVRIYTQLFESLWGQSPRGKLAANFQ